MINFGPLLMVLLLLCKCGAEESFDCSDSSESDESDEKQVYCDGQRNSKEKDQIQSKLSTTTEEICNASTTIYSCSGLNDEYVCSAEGRFPDLSDSNCKRYFECEKLSDGSLNKKILVCPNSPFCPSTQKCSSVFKCPCVDTESSTSSRSKTTVAEKVTTSATTSTSNGFKITPYTCSLESDNTDNFNCTVWGRFPDLTDYLCQRYFLCSYLQNGSFVKTQYKCLNSVFDPTSKKCSKQYECPCTTLSSSSTSLKPTTTTKAITTSKIEELTTLANNTTKSTHSTAESMSTSSSNGFTTTSPATTVSYTCSFPSREVGKFNCTLWGRFPDLTDHLCQKYFLCSYLQNGSFVKTEYKCVNSVFDPETKRCSKQYVCPCSTSSNTPSSVALTTSGVINTTSEIPFTTTIKESTIASSITPKHTTAATNAPTTENLTTIHDSTTSSKFTTIYTTTKLSYICSSSPNEIDKFNCTVWGRFPDLTDFLCQRYFLCSYLQNGSFVKTRYQCLNSVFDPEAKRCSKQYTCPCSTSSSISFSASPTTSVNTTAYSTTTFSIASTTTEVLTTEPAQITTTASTTTKSIATTSEKLATDPERPTTSTTNLRTESTSIGFSDKSTTISVDNTSLNEFTTISAPTSTSYLCLLSHYDVFEFTCTDWGRFPDFTDSSCQRYFLCSNLQNGSFVKTEYHCLNSVFDPEAKRCSKQFACPCSTYSSTSTITASETTSIGITAEETSTESFTSAITESSSRITSSEKLTSMPVSTTVSREFTTTSVSTTASYRCSLSSNETHDFVCGKWGRFPDFTDFYCQKYFLCSTLQNGSFVKTEYKCLNSVFDPETSRCSKTYTCPCSTLTSTSTPISSTTLSSINSSEVETTVFNCASGYRNYEFTCTQEGRFPDFTDATCRNYFLCSHLRNGTFIRTPYACLNSFFNPLICKCSISYICPCKNNQTVVTSPLSSEPVIYEGFTKIN